MAIKTLSVSISMATNIEIIRGAQHTEYSAYQSCNVTRTEISFTYQGKQRLIINAATACDDPAKEPFIVREYEERIKSYVEQLTRHNGKYYNEKWIKPYSLEDVITWHEQDGMTFTESTAFIQHAEPDGRIMFSGNFNEYSRGFFFVIYDTALAKAMMKRFPEVTVRTY